MENLLQNILYVIVRVDDILLSGANDGDHLKKNWKKSLNVLQRLDCD